MAASWLTACRTSSLMPPLPAPPALLPGEELTFDYSSVTESEKEFRDAICLCSTRNCRHVALVQQRWHSSAGICSGQGQANVGSARAAGPRFS